VRDGHSPARGRPILLASAGRHSRTCWNGRWNSRSPVPGTVDALWGTGGFKDQNG